MPAAEPSRWLPPRPRSAAWLVAALHVALLAALAWQTSRQTLERQTDRQAPLMLQWFTPAPSRPASPLLPRAARATHAPQATRVHLPVPVRRPAEVPIAAGPAAVAALPASAASRPETAAPDIPLLATDATHRAVLGIARQVPIGEQAALASAEPQPLRPEERLGREVAKSAIGNCAKGEFAGGGLGLLSLPFFIAAEVNGKCRK